MPIACYFPFTFRLEFYRKNKENNPSTSSSSVVATVIWPSEGFKQITASHLGQLPPLTEETISAYLSVRIAPDGNPHRDLQALKKGRLVVESRKVEALSLLIRERVYWLTGICAASMKKGVDYYIMQMIFVPAT